MEPNKMEKNGKQITGKKNTKWTERWQKGLELN